MPKRAATPPPDKDSEPKFLTITYPYPLYANLEDKRDLLDMAHWLGCVVEPRHLDVFYWKPSGHNHVIIEVSRNMPAFERLLGEHRWSDFIVNPSDEEKGMVTRIYWSTYSTRRQITKEGWKSCEVSDSWYVPGKWDKKRFRSPYPASAWCDLANEDPTNKSFCRHIPKSMFGGIDATPPEIVASKPAKSKLAVGPAPGTPAWCAMKNGTGPAAPHKSKPGAPGPASTSAWNKPIVVNANKARGSNEPAAWGASVEDSDAGALAAAASGRANMVPVDPREEDLDDLSELGGPHGRSWADEVTETERRKEEKPLSAGPGAYAWPPPGQVAEEEEYEDQDPEEIERRNSAISAMHNLPTLTPQDEIRAFAPQNNHNMRSYNGGLGRDELKGWSCPDHGEVKLCSRGVCIHASKEVNRRRNLASNPRTRTEEQLGPFLRSEQKGAGGIIRHVDRSSNKDWRKNGSSRSHTASPAPSMRQTQSAPPRANGPPANMWARGPPAAVRNNA